MHSDTPSNGWSKPASALIIGGGIGGMRAALDLANSGIMVYLVEQTPCLGGRVSQLGYMFPQHDCVLCRGTPDHGYGCTRPSISPAYIHHNQHPNIQILTNTRVIDVQGQAGDFSIALRSEPRYVEVERCINCGYCAQVCQVEMADNYQQGMTTRKAAYKVATRAAPDVYTIDYGPYCNTCKKCVGVCPTDAINLQEQPRLQTIVVGAIILALGFQIYDPSLLEELGYTRYPNVISAMAYERLASRSGPTEGMVLRPSDQHRPHSITWLQCIGSRDKTNSFCSSICCMYATKEAVLAKQRLGADVECTVFIMDQRGFNKEYSTYFDKARNQHGIQYLRCRISKIHQDPLTKDLLLQYVDEDGSPREQRTEMVVLATGLQPPSSAQELAHLLQIELDSYGFCKTDKFTPLQTSRPGIFVCGAFSTPKEISETIIDASGAAAEVMRLLNDRLNTHTFTRELPYLVRDDLEPERDVSEEDPRIGVFVCNCGGTIGDVVNIADIVRQAEQWPGVVSTKSLQLACFPEGLSLIQDAVDDYNLNRVVVAACSSRTHESLFQRTIREKGLNPYLLELANIREHCSLVHRGQSDLPTRKARELVRMAAGRVAAAKPVYKDKHRCRPNAVIIGGGIAGMTAALAIADSGYDVHLVERSEILGGNLLNLYYVAEGYDPQRLLRDLVNRVRAHQRIEVFTRTEVVDHSGHVGFFKARLRTRLPDNSTSEQVIEHGVTILTTGGNETRGHPWLSMQASHPQLITQRDLEYKIVHHPEEIAALKNVVMIQCVRPPDTLEYCSRVCCTNAIKNAIRLKLFNPSCQVTIIYKNIVTYGFREEYYTEARKHGVVFVRYGEEEPPEICSDGDGLKVRVRELTLNRMMELSADLVPISMAVVPSEGTKKLANMLRLPLSSEGFFQEAQMKLRPMDFTREGIFLAGMAHYPKFLEETMSHALAAAARALPLLSQQSLHLGGIVARVDTDKCAGCLTCTRTCPFGIPQVVQQEGRTGVGGLGGSVFIDAAQCQGCGTCTGECPANAIQLVHYRDEQIMLSSIAGIGSWGQTSNARVTG